MQLIFNDHSLELELYNTNFVDAWCNWVFNESNELDLNFDYNRVKQLHSERLTLIDKLDTILNAVNEIAVSMGLPDKWHYELSNLYDSNFLQRTHEQWAMISKEANEKHLPLYDAQVAEIWNAHNQKLAEQSKHYNDINSWVHHIEFQYKFFSMSRVMFNRSDEAIKSYNITPSDTSFIKDAVTIPFNDIGRPQYEKFCISGNVTNPEISNYNNVINAVELSSTPVQTPIDPRFITTCEQQGVEQWGLNVCVAKNKEIDTQLMGYTVISNFTEGENRMILKR